MQRRVFLILFLSALTLIAFNQTRTLDFYLEEGLRNSPLLNEYRNRISSAKTDSLENIKDRFKFLPDGKLKPLKTLADVRLKEGVAEINHDNLKSVSIVTARLNNRDLGSAIKEIQEIIGIFAKKF